MEEKRREQAVEWLREAIQSGGNGEEALWEAVVAFQNVPCYTSSGLPFSYTVRCRKNGEYSGELLISRKEGSKTLTKSSVLLAFHRVQTDFGDTPPFYKGPKAIGQIFGISYVYSLFWKWGLIQVPPQVEQRLRGRE